MTALKFKQASIFTKIVVVVLVLYAAVTLITLHSRIQNAQQENADLAQQVEDATAENAELEYDINHSTDDEVIEGIARDKIGLVMPGEEIYYDN